MTDAGDPDLAEFYRHQAMLLPHTGAHIGRSNLDVGCGSGITSVIHAEQLGTAPVLCDVIDIRHRRAQAFPFRLLQGADLPFPSRSFESSYLQYVLHHVPDEARVLALLRESARVSGAVVIVEEVVGARTDLVRARAFDQEVNALLHPGVAMPVFQYFPAGELKRLLAAARLAVSVHAEVSAGSQDNGFLETHVIVGRT